MKHFIKIAISYVPKNKLEKEIIDLIDSHDGTLLEKTHLNTFISGIRNDIVKLNIKYQRCTGKELKEWYSGDGTVSFMVDGVVKFDAYSVLKES